MPVIVIGGGIAGPSAALYTSRGNFRTLVIEGDEPGGQLTKTTYVDNWPGVKRTLGKYAVAQVKKQAADYGTEFLNDHVSSVDFSSWPFVVRTVEGLELRALSVVVATGATPRYLGVPGEQEFWGRGVTACAICDAPACEDQEVVIVGGGDAAVEEATQLAVYASKVTVLVRKGRMRAAPTMQERLKNYPNVSVRHNVEIQEILGDEMGVTGVRLLNNMTKETFVLPTFSVFLAIGRIPNTQIFSEYLDMDPVGHIDVKGRLQKTSVVGVTAAGDAADPDYKQAVIAAGDGAKAGLDTNRFLTNLGLNESMARALEPSLFEGGQTDEEQEEAFESITSLAEFEEKVIKSDVPVVLDFYTDYCPSCLHMLTKIASVARRYTNRIKVYKVDAEAAVDLVTQLGIPRVPRLLVYSKGKKVVDHNEEMDRKELQELFKSLTDETATETEVTVPVQ